MAKRHRITVNGISFMARSGELLLDAALKNGIDLPHDCRAGHCGTCCVRLVTGELQGGKGSEPGIVHPCQCRIVGDAVVERDEATGTRTVEGVVSSLQLLSPSVVEVGITTKRALPYLPGQYVHVGFRGYPNRPFSLTHPLQGNAGGRTVFFHIRRMEKGRVSSALGRGIKQGHPVRLTGPLGSAYFRSNVDGRLILVATNTGFAPIWSIAGAALRENPERRLMLIAGGRAIKALYMGPALARLAKFPRVLVVPVCSSPQSVSAVVKPGRPTDYLPRLLPTDVLYACGAPAMVSSVQSIASQAGAVCYADPFLPSHDDRIEGGCSRVRLDGSPCRLGRRQGIAHGTATASDVGSRSVRRGWLRDGLVAMIDRRAHSFRAIGLGGSGTLASAICLHGLLAISVMAGAALADETAKIMGPNACGECHKEEVKAWQESHHFKTFRDMPRNTKANKIADKLGVRRIKSESLCLGCHYTVQPKDNKKDVVAGISCESCHSPAQDWIKVHSGYSGKKAETESKTEAAARWKLAASKGMIRPRSLYELAKNCYSCHVVPQEELVNKGGHKAGSAFDLVAWSQGEVRHNTWHSKGKENVPANAARKRMLYLVGLGVELETGIRAVGRATARKPYAFAMAKRVDRARKQLAVVAKAAPNVPEVAKMVELAYSAGLKLNNKGSLAAAADGVSKLLVSITEKYDGSTMSGLDSFIPGPDKFKGRARVPQATN